MAWRRSSLGLFGRLSVQARLTRSVSTLKGSYDNILVERKGCVGLVKLNRPKALNALCNALFDDLIHATRALDADQQVAAIVLTGMDNNKAFAAGADIKEMSKMTYMECYRTNMFSQWAEVTKISKPIIAAVNGYALGGGCELMMMCDIVIAGENAKFGQPEISLGVIPGCGGTQRLIRAIGKSKAMEMILTGNMIDAKQAERDGLVSKVVPTEETLSTAMKMAEKIGTFSKPAVAMAKETVNASYEMTLAEGVRFERRIFHSMFAMDDQKEGMAAFAEKRPPNFTHK